MDRNIPVAYGAPVPLACPGTHATPTMAEAWASPTFVAAADDAISSSSAASPNIVLPEPRRSNDDPITAEQLSRLKEQGYTEGLAQSLASSISAFPLRIWVVDNSGSMAFTDGHRLVETNRVNDVRMAACTRWREIQDTVKYHAQMAALLRAPTIFRLLNDPGPRVGPAQFGVADKVGLGNKDDYERSVELDLQLAIRTMNNVQPGGSTPLTRHVREICRDVSALAPSLNERGAKVVIVLATDGLPTDEHGVCDAYQKSDFVDAIRSLEGLPVWLVVRLCTDDEIVVNFYNDLDAQLELSVEVLDDFVGEADEVHKFNRWINYTLPIHRCREMGFHHRIMDLLDERRLTTEELVEFCRLLFGDSKIEGAPDPLLDLKGFLVVLQKLLRVETPQYNPVKRKSMPWLNVKKIQMDYGKKRKWRLL